MYTPMVVVIWYIYIITFSYLLYHNRKSLFTQLKLTLKFNIWQKFNIWYFSAKTSVSQDVVSTQLVNSLYKKNSVAVDTVQDDDVSGFGFTDEENCKHNVYLFYSI